MEYPCIVCEKEVRPRQHAVACDVCSNWQHRICNTGISQKEYRSAVRGRRELNFVCGGCSPKDQNDNVDLKFQDRLPLDESPVAQTPTHSTVISETKTVTPVTPWSIGQSSCEDRNNDDSDDQTIQSRLSEVPLPGPTTTDSDPPGSNEPNYPIGDTNSESVISTPWMDSDPDDEPHVPRKTVYDFTETSSDDSDDPTQIPRRLISHRPTRDSSSSSDSSSDDSEDPTQKQRRLISPRPTRDSSSSGDSSSDDSDDPTQKQRRLISPRPTRDSSSSGDSSSDDSDDPTQKPRRLISPRPTRDSSSSCDSSSGDSDDPTQKPRRLISPRPTRDSSSSSDSSNEDIDPSPKPRRSTIKMPPIGIARCDRSFFLDTSSDASDHGDREDVPLTYTLIENGSQRGKDLLTDSHGYTYCVKKRSCHVTSWRCRVKTWFWECRASVSQRGTRFTAGPTLHMHLPHLYKSKDARLKVKIDKRVPVSSGQTARTIIQDSINELKTNQETSPIGDKTINRLIRRTNRVKTKLRQTTPSEQTSANGNDDNTEPSISQPKPTMYKAPLKGDVETNLKQSSVSKTTRDGNIASKPNLKPLQQTGVSKTTRDGNIASKPNLKPLQQTGVSKTTRDGNIASKPNLKPLQQTGVSKTTRDGNIASKPNLKPLQQTGVSKTTRDGNIASKPNIKPLQQTGVSKTTRDGNIASKPNLKPLQQTGVSKTTRGGNIASKPKQVKKTNPSLYKTTLKRNAELKRSQLHESRPIPVTAPNVVDSTNKQQSKLAPVQTRPQRPVYPCTARSIVEGVLLKEYNDLKDVPPSIRIENLIRIVNRARAKKRKEYLEENPEPHTDAADPLPAPASKPHTLQPPRRTPVEVDHESLRGKEEGRPF